MPSATTSTKPTKTKAPAVAIEAGESIVTIRKGDSKVRMELGAKISAAMRQRKRRPDVESASQGLRSIREGC